MEGALLLLDDLREARAARAAWREEGGPVVVAGGFPEGAGQVPGRRGRFKLWQVKYVQSEQSGLVIMSVLCFAKR